MLKARGDLLGTLLVGAGMMMLVDRLGFLRGLSSWLWGIVFLAGGVALLLYHGRDAARWWALFPGFGLIALAAAVFAGHRGGTVFLAFAGAAALAAYLTRRSRWWALVAAGALLSLALLAIVDGVAPNLDNGWIFFAGLAATFVWLYLRGATPSDRPTYAPATGQGPGGLNAPLQGSIVTFRLPWALYPALGFGALALVSLLTGRAVETLVALALLAAGGLLRWRHEAGLSRSLAERSGSGPG